MTRELICYLHILYLHRREITKKERIQEPLKHLKLVGCVMKNHQLKVYNNIEDENFGAFNRPGMMTSNIVFPIPLLQPVITAVLFLSNIT